MKSLTEGFRYKKSRSERGPKIRVPKSPGSGRSSKGGKGDRGDGSAEVKDRRQNAVVKAAFVDRHRTEGRGQSFSAALGKHLGYVGREGAGLDGERPELFTSPEQAGEGLPTEEIQDEKRFYKIIVSPDNAERMDLDKYAVDLMAEVENRTGYKLKWVASVHKNTSQHHIHFIIRGVDQTGREVNLKDFNGKGFREAAREIATQHLGYRSELEIKSERERAVEMERPTWIDRKIVRLLSERGAITAKDPLILKRLEKLEAMGLATRTRSRGYEVEPDLLTKLKSIGERGDILKTISKLGYHGKDISFANDRTTMSGTVVKKEIRNELYDTSFVLIRDKSSGRVYYYEGPGTRTARVGDEAKIEGGRARFGKEDKSYRPDQDKDFSSEKTKDEGQERER